MIVLAALGFFVLLFVVVLLWILIPALYGLPPVPTHPGRIQKALTLAGLKPHETLYDLGAGDGRVLFIAARDFGAKAVGLEIGPMQCVMIWLRVTASGLGNKIQVRWANFYKADLNDADLVFVYATSKEVMKLAPHLAGRMKKGARLVSLSADFPEWEPATMDGDRLIFVYEMPPSPGGVTSYMLRNVK